MILTKDNMILAKYASKWILNIYKQAPTIDKRFIYCALELIGENKIVMDDIVDSIITNKIAKYYPHDMKFYENWCNLTLYSKESRIQNLLQLMARYPLTAPIVESVIIEALSDNIKSIRGGLERHSIFKNLYLPKEFTKIEYEFILLLYALANFPKISAFIKYNTTIMKDRHQIAVILGADDRLVQKAEITITALDLMSYKGEKLKISHELIKC